MPQLRRLAIVAEDPAKLAAFYQEVFELDRMGAEGGAVFLSDGTFNLALLPRTSGMATGLQGLGFEAVRVESILIKLAPNANADQNLVERNANTGVEYAMRDPDGNVIGLCSGLSMCRFDKAPCPFVISRFTLRRRNDSPIFIARSWT